MYKFQDITDYLAQTRERGGSDLHLCVDAPPAARINGELTPLETVDLDAASCREMVLAVLTETQRSRLEQDWELDFGVNVANVGRFRGNAHFCRGNLEATFRYIPREIPDLATLGHSATVDKFCRERQGLILVAGMTGQGKTTTLAAMTRRISEERSCVIVTIEDPIEYLFDHRYGLVKQRQVGQDTASFATAIRSALRQDPDVLVVSEMRDLETMAAALTAASTGHLVIASLHTIDAPKAFDRIIDSFPPAQQSQVTTQIANSLVGVITQRLLPRLDKPGRVMATDILVSNPGIRAVLRDRRTEQIPGLMQIGGNLGMHTMDDSLGHLLANGHISLDEALLNCRDRDFIFAKLDPQSKKRS